MDVRCVFFRCFLGELCHSFCSWHIKRHIEPIRNSWDFWRAGIFVFWSLKRIGGKCEVVGLACNPRMINARKRTLVSWSWSYEFDCVCYSKPSFAHTELLCFIWSWLVSFLVSRFYLSSTRDINWLCARQPILLYLGSQLFIKLLLSVEQTALLG